MGIQKVLYVQIDGKEYIDNFTLKNVCYTGCKKEAKNNNNNLHTQQPTNFTENFSSKVYNGSTIFHRNKMTLMVATNRLMVEKKVIFLILHLVI